MSRAATFPFVVSVLLVSVLPSAGPSPGIPNEFDRRYALLRDSIYDQSHSIEHVRTLYEEVLGAVSEAQLPEKKRYYWFARVEYLMGRAEQNEERNKRAAEHYQKSVQHIESSLEYGEYSEGYRMLSDSVGQLCMVEGIGYMLSNGLNVKRYARKALELNPRNGKAHIIIGSSYIYPPPLYGGNPSKGIEVMHYASTMPDIEKDDLFNIYSGIGIGYGKLDDRPKSAYWLEKALELYPNNMYVSEEYDKLR
jgi:tetratricopeptide (TPR) repeat protein